jgi:hypothetical protein
MAKQLSGETILAEDIVNPNYVLKSATESVTSSTTLQDDNDFSFALTPGIWRIEVYLHCTGAAAGAGDIKTAWTNTGTMTNLARTLLGAGIGQTSVTAQNVRYQGLTGLSTNAQFGLTAQTAVVKEELLIDVSSSGTLTLQWAQQTSSGTATSVLAGSRAFLTQVDAF